MENIQENIASAAQNAEFSGTSSETKCEILPNETKNSKDYKI